MEMTLGVGEGAGGRRKKKMNKKKKGYFYSRVLCDRKAKSGAWFHIYYKYEYRVQRKIYFYTSSFQHNQFHLIIYLL
jgi:ribosomal protein L20